MLPNTMVCAVIHMCVLSFDGLWGTRYQRTRPNRNNYTVNKISMPAAYVPAESSTMVSVKYIKNLLLKEEMEVKDESLADLNQPFISLTPPNKEKGKNIVTSSEDIHGQLKDVDGAEEENNTKKISSSYFRSNNMILSSDDDTPSHGSKGSVNAKYKRLKKLTDSGTSSGAGKNTEIVDDNAAGYISTNSDDDSASDEEVLAKALA